MNIHENNADTTINDLEKDIKNDPNDVSVELTLSRQAHFKQKSVSEEMDDLFNTGNFIVYTQDRLKNTYSKELKPSFGLFTFDVYTLIHKQNEQIADYLLKFPNSKTKLEYSLHDFKDEKISGTVDADFFFKTYQSEKFYKYRLKEPTPTNNTQVQEETTLKNNILFKLPNGDMTKVTKKPHKVHGYNEGWVTIEYEPKIVFKKGLVHDVWTIFTGNIFLVDMELAMTNGVQYKTEQHPVNNNDEIEDYTANTNDMLNFNGGYIEASQEAYDLLNIKGYLEYHDDRDDEHTPILKNINMFSYFLIKNDTIYAWTSKPDGRGLKQFYINNKELSWTKPEEIEITVNEDLADAFESFEIEVTESNSNFIEREHFIARVSSIIGISYVSGKMNMRLKNNGYINVQVSKSEFKEIVEEFKEKAQ